MSDIEPTEPVTVEEAETSRRKAVTWVRLSRIVGVVLIMSVLAFGGYLMFANTALRATLAAEQQQNTEQRAENAELRDKVDALHEQVIATGEDPVTEPSSGTRGERGDKGEPGRPPTEREIVDAVIGVCSSSTLCTGPPGTATKGDTGAPGLQGDRGEKGDKGDKGDPGADSTVPGPQGAPGPTCPAGTTQTNVLIDTYVEGDLLPTRRQVVACVFD